MQIPTENDVGLDDRLAAEGDIGGAGDLGSAGDFVAGILGKLTWSAIERK